MLQKCHPLSEFYPFLKLFPLFSIFFSLFPNMNKSCHAFCCIQNIVCLLFKYMCSLILPCWMRIMFKSDDIMFWSSHLMLWSNDIMLWCDNIMLSSNHLILWSNDIMLWCDNIMLWSNEKMLWCDDTMLWGNEHGHLHF